MIRFNPREEKYVYCCFFDAHVTTLASVLMAIFDVSYILYLVKVTSEEDFLPFLGIPIICLGVYGLYNEARIPLFIYMIINVGFKNENWMRENIKFIAAIILMIYILGIIATDPKINIPDQQGVAIPGALLVCTLILLLQIPYTSVLWDLIKFIRDREKFESTIV